MHVNTENNAKAKCLSRKFEFVPWNINFNGNEVATLFPCKIVLVSYLFQKHIFFVNPHQNLENCSLKKITTIIHCNDDYFFARPLFGFFNFWLPKTINQ